MALRIIVSYDDTDNDRDALALGRLLAFPGAELSLAYVRHSTQEEDEQEAFEQRQAEELLERGAAEIGAPEMPRHVVVNASTSDGLTELAEREDADIVVFGSDYRTAAGPAEARDRRPQNAARRARGDRRRPGRPARSPSVRVSTIGVIDEGDETARETAESLAAALGATVARLRRRPRRPARRRLAARVAAGPGDPQRRQRLRGRGRDLPGARGPARHGDQLRRRLRPSLPLPDQDDGRDRGVAAVDPTLRGLPLDLSRLPPRGHLGQGRQSPIERLDLDLDRRRRRPLRSRALRFGEDAGGDVLGAALGVRPALAEARARAGRGPGPRGPSARSSADPIRGRRARSAAPRARAR